MNQKNKELLLKYLSAIVPYGVFVEYDYGDSVKRVTKFHGNYLYLMMLDKLQWKDFKPYLRPLSSMTEEEWEELNCIGYIVPLYDGSFGVDMRAYCKNGQPHYMRFSDFSTIEDWLNAHHLDYHGLISMNLALEAPEGMYNIKEYNKKHKEEPVSEDLEEAASRYAKEEYSRKSPATLPDRCKGCYAPLMYAFKAGAQWQKEHLWKDAQSDDLPEIDKEVIALIEAFGHYKVIFAHRVDENAEIHTSIDGKPLVLHPKRHDKGGWNIPNIKWWLDIELPKMEE